MKLKKITKRDILYLSISMFVIVIVWISLNLYHSYVTSTISEDLQLQIIPIDASFDAATIEKLKSRNKVVPIFENNLQQTSPSATISPNPENSEEATPSGEQVTVEPSVTEEPTVIP